VTTTGEFLPSTHGLHFSNSWPIGTPDYTVNVPIVGDVTIGDASNGLCGGMVFTVADLYNALLQPPPDSVAPASGSPLFNYVAARLIDSFNLPDGVLTYYYWANTPDHDTGLWPIIRSGLARMTIQDQVPQIIASIDRNRPAAIGLVTIASFNPGDLGQCHQVLAYGYQWAGNELTLRVYDPNRANRDDVTISLDISDPGHTTAIRSTVGITRSIRGFFYTDYGVVDPSSVSGPPQGTVSRDAVFVSQTLPAAVVAGQTYPVAVTMRNVGIQAWAPQKGYRLGSQHPPNNQTWGRNRVELPGVVAPAQEVTFSFDVTAPQRLPAHIQWRMLEENVEWFGEPTPNRVPAAPGTPVRYGTTLMLRHTATNCSLHSHPLTYGHPGSSGQQQVTCFSGADDNDLWRIKGPHGQPEESRAGEPVQNGEVVRLEHVSTSKNLHSHVGIPSPVTGQQEITCYERAAVGDYNDNWRVEVDDSGQWAAGKQVRLIHASTHVALHSHAGFTHPEWTTGQQEVTGFAGRDGNDLWYASDFRSLDARFVSQAVQADMVMGDSQAVTVTMRNVGTELWTPGSYRLGSQRPENNQLWGLNRVDLTGAVAPGAETRFSFQITAPAAPGLTDFQWRMLQEGGDWFGQQTDHKYIRIVGRPGSAIVPNVVGMANRMARTTMRASDLVPTFVGAQGVDTEVVKQTPAAGATIPRGSGVTLQMKKLI